MLRSHVHRRQEEQQAPADGGLPGTEQSMLVPNAPNEGTLLSVPGCAARHHQDNPGQLPFSATAGERPAPYNLPDALGLVRAVHILRYTYFGFSGRSPHYFHQLSYFATPPPLMLQS